MYCKISKSAIVVKKAPLFVLYKVFKNVVNVLNLQKIITLLLIMLEKPFEILQWEIDVKSSI